MEKSEARLYIQKVSPVHCVRWTGDLKALPPVFKGYTKTPLIHGRLETSPQGAVMKRGITTYGLRVGDWIVRDRDGNLEVIGKERFALEYQVYEGDL